jgi:hypothetical protein
LLLQEQEEEEEEEKEEEEEEEEEEHQDHKPSLKSRTQPPVAVLSGLKHTEEFTCCIM